MSSRLATWPRPEYRIEIEFHAPREFAYRWCTDFSSEDGRLEGERYTRKVLSRSPKHIVFEDLEEGPSGFIWSREDVDLLPPHRWRMDSVGSHRSVHAEYRLTEPRPGWSRLELRFRRRPTRLAGKQLTKAQRERATLAGWRSFKRALEADFRKSRGTSASKKRR